MGLNPQVIGKEMPHGFAGCYARQPDMIVNTRPAGGGAPIPFGTPLKYDGAEVVPMGAAATAAQFVGVAGAEIKSALTYLDQSQGQYAPGEPVSVFQRGAINVQCQRGTPALGGAVNSPVTAGGANGIPVVQASVDKGVYKAHVFAAALRVMFQDMQRANYIGRSLDNLLQDGVRMAYDKHMDANGYVGIGDYGTTGLVNNPDATETTAVNGAKGTAAWATKTPQEILKDVNDAITSVWAANEYDETAVPNHILIPYEQYNYILTTMVTDLATETIYDFLLKNNASAKNGGSLFIGATRWCKGAGTGDKDRMVVYVNHERFVKMDELVPMSRIMSAPNVANVCYDTAYMANLSEVQIFYPTSILYVDGI